MRFLKRFNTIFYKMVISYITIIIIITLVLGITSYAYFSSSLKNEVERVQEKILENKKNTIELTVFEKVEKVYIDLSSPLYPNQDVLYLFDYPADGNHSKISDISRILESTRTNNAEVIDSIQIFYKRPNLMISSQFGVKYLNDAGSKAYLDTDWLKGMINSQDDTLWMETRPFRANMEWGGDPDTVSMITYVCRYPVSFRQSENKGLMAFNIKESTISSIFKDMVIDQHNTVFVIGPEGHIISDVNKDMLNQDLSSQSYVKEILGSEKTYGSFADTVNGRKSVISFTTLEQTGWKLVAVTSVDRFYTSSAMVQRMFILLCLAAILIGLLMTGIFTSSIYNPLRSLLVSVKNLFGEVGQQSPKRENEYAIINNVINNLSVKISELEDTLKTNLPIIRHNLVLSLLKSTVTQDELKEHLKLLQLSVGQSSFNVILFEFGVEAINSLNIENRQFVKYNLIKHFEDLTTMELGNEALCIAAELSEISVGVIIGGDGLKNVHIYKLVNNIIAYVRENFMIPVTAASGIWVDSLPRVYLSYLEAQKYLTYKYFMQDCLLLDEDNLSEREKSNEKMPDSLLEELSQGLKLRDINIIKAFTAAFMKQAAEGNYSAAHCHEKLIQALFILSNYVRDMRYESDAHKKGNFNNSFSCCTDIVHLMNMLLDYIKDIFEFVDRRNNSYNEESIEKIKSYICEHIGEELSLETVADRFSLNFRYLSRLFKNETGMNYVDFVTQKRLERARELLLNTDLNIDQIGIKSGFNSPAYFIRRFKEVYGETPKNYKRFLNEGK